MGTGGVAGSAAATAEAELRVRPVRDLVLSAALCDTSRPVTQGQASGSLALPLLTTRMVFRMIGTIEERAAHIPVGQRSHASGQLLVLSPLALVLASQRPFSPLASRDCMAH